MLISKKLKAPSLSRGFTLVELLVVIAIIGVLSSLVLLQLGTARAKARDAKRVSDVSSLRTASELFFDDNGGRYETALTIANLGPYFTAPALPVDPTTAAAYGYAFHPLVNPQRYQVWTELERTNTSALGSDSDICSNANVAACNSAGAIWTGGATVDGRTEVCTPAGANDCIYDLGQN